MYRTLSSLRLSHHLGALGCPGGGPLSEPEPTLLLHRRRLGAIPEKTAELAEERRLEARPVEAEDTDLPEVGKVVVAEEHAVLARLLPHAAADDSAAVGERLVDGQALRVGEGEREAGRRWGERGVSGACGRVHVGR